MKPFLLTSDRDRIQTYNLLIRSQMLYSIELRSHFPLTDGKNKAKTLAGKINISVIKVFMAGNGCAAAFQ